MLKKLLTIPGIATALVVGVLLGGLTLGSVFAQTPPNPTPTQATVQNSDEDAAEAGVKGPDMDAVEEQVEEQNEVDEQEPQYTGSILVNGAQYEGMSEADEVAALQGLATISANDAEQAALAANPGTTVIETELDNEDERPLDDAGKPPLVFDNQNSHTRPPQFSRQLRIILTRR